MGFWSTFGKYALMAAPAIATLGGAAPLTATLIGASAGAGKALADGGGVKEALLSAGLGAAPGVAQGIGGAASVAGQATSAATQPSMWTQLARNPEFWKTTAGAIGAATQAAGKNRSSLRDAQIAEYVASGAGPDPASPRLRRRASELEEELLDRLNPSFWERFGTYAAPAAAIYASTLPSSTRR